MVALAMPAAALSPPTPRCFSLYRSTTLTASAITLPALLVARETLIDHVSPFGNGNVPRRTHFPPFFRWSTRTHFHPDTVAIPIRVELFWRELAGHQA